MSLKWISLYFYIVSFSLSNCCVVLNVNPVSSIIDKTCYYLDMNVHLVHLKWVNLFLSTWPQWPWVEWFIAAGPMGSRFDFFHGHGGGTEDAVTLISGYFNGFLKVNVSLFDQYSGSNGQKLAIAVEMNGNTRRWFLWIGPLWCLSLENSGGKIYWFSFTVIKLVT